MGIVLENELLRLAIDPGIGASVVGFELRRDGDLLPLLRPAPDPLGRSSNASSFTLAPYSNRIRDGVFCFEGRGHRLRHGEKHAIHGDVRDRPWRVVSKSATGVAVEIDSRDFADFNFPFPIVCRARFALEGPILAMSLRLENAGSERMPAGFGFHPYFERALVAGENVRLGFRVTGVYPGETPLPTGPPIPVPGTMDFSKPRSLEVTLDQCFSGWDGRALLEWPVSGVRAHVEASSVFGHVILYSPAGEPFFALEPVTNANDGLNLLASGQAGTGVVVLAAGEALEGEVRIRIEAH